MSAIQKAIEYCVVRNVIDVIGGETELDQGLCEPEVVRRCLKNAGDRSALLKFTESPGRSERFQTKDSAKAR